MIVLSLFDGISCGRVALERAGINIERYYSSEIDKYAIQISKKNYSDIIQLGDINAWINWNIEKPELIIGGSPCQGFSFAGKQLAFDDSRSALFWKYVEIVKHYKPKYFLLENVRMKKEHLQVITDALGVDHICINSALVSAQNRVRYYWTNIHDVTQPTDKNIDPKSIINSQCGYAASSNKNSQGTRIVTIKDKFNCIVANYYKGLRANSRPGVLLNKYYDNKLYDELYPREFRMLTPVECERLQTLPDNYTNGVSNTQRYKMLGNAWTIDVLVHIFSFIKKSLQN